MKIYVSIFLLSFFLVASCSEKKKNATDELYENVMAAHDEIMLKMSDIMKYKKQLNAKLVELTEKGTDSLKTVNVKKAIDDLDKSHEEMMNWMHGFSSDFEGKVKDEAMEYLQTQKAKIEAVGEMTNTALKYAEEILEE